MFRQAAAAVTELLFPRRCSGCRATGTILCAECAALLPRVPEPQCPKCGLPLTQPGRPCGHCADFPLDIEALRSPYLYTGDLRSALLRFKYLGARTAAHDLGPLLAAYVQTTGWRPDIVAGVPLYPQRQRRRGYNQADALAGQVATLLRLPQLAAVRRLKDTPPQAQQPDRHARWQNVAAAFYADVSEVSGARVLLIDDVCTTGATVNACGVALKRAGARAVYGLTLARVL